jgi:hypothetical protein
VDVSWLWIATHFEKSSQLCTFHSVVGQILSLFQSSSPLRTVGIDSVAVYQHHLSV